MPSSATFSTPVPRLPRGRVSIDDGLTLDVDPLAPGLRERQPTKLTLTWKGTDVQLVMERVGDELVMRGGPTDPDRIALAPVEVLGGKVRYFFVCAGCGRRRKHMHLPRGSTTWRCRACHRLAPRRHGADPVDGLQTRWEEIGHQIARLRLVRSFGASPLIRALVEGADDHLDAMHLKREIAALKQVLDRMAPPSALVG